MTASFEYQFPAIKGIQAQREYFISMCPLKLIPKIFIFDEEELVPELRAQRILNKTRIPEMASYVTANPGTYVFSAITASIDGDVRFASLTKQENRIGVLHVDMQAKFIINDGQHRRAAIEQALKEKPEVGDETIAVVFFLDRGLTRCQQMFADLNRYAIRPSPSLGLLYDHRDAKAQLTKIVVSKSAAFRNMVEMEKSSLSARSRKLFTLSALHSANTALIQDEDLDAADDIANHCAAYWDAVDEHIPEWGFVRSSQMTAGDVRRDFIHSHAIVLQVLGEIGNSLIKAQPRRWQKTLSKLRDIDWSRSNYDLWEGRALIAGRVSKARNNVILTRNVVKQRLGLDLSPEEQRLEDLLQRGEAK